MWVEGSIIVCKLNNQIIEKKHGIKLIFGDDQGPVTPFNLMEIIERWIQCLTLKFPDFVIYVGQYLNVYFICENSYGLLNTKYLVKTRNSAKVSSKSDTGGNSCVKICLEMLTNYISNFHMYIIFIIQPFTKFYLIFI